MGDTNRTVTFVCTGNTCRSPMAAGLLRHALAAEGPPLDKLTVVSAGVAAMDGAPASPEAVKVLDRSGIDIADHASRFVTEELLADSLVVLAMTENHRQAIRERYPDIEAPVLLMREPLGEEPLEISDPVGGPLELYTGVRDQMVEAIPPLVAWLRERLSG